MALGLVEPMAKGKVMNLPAYSPGMGDDLPAYSPGLGDKVDDAEADVECSLQHTNNAQLKKGMRSSKFDNS
jgi:hypothetical protein